MNALQLGKIGKVEYEYDGFLHDYLWNLVVLQLGKEPNILLNSCSLVHKMTTFLLAQECARELLLQGLFIGCSPIKKFMG